jgi:hypothetical protein
MEGMNATIAFYNGLLQAYRPDIEQREDVSALERPVAKKK